MQYNPYKIDYIYHSDKCKLQALLKKYNKGCEIYKYIEEEILQKKDKIKDKDLYQMIRKKFGSLKQFNEYSQERAKQRARDIEIIYKKIIYNPIKINSYLDIGIGNGLITYQIADRFFIKDDIYSSTLGLDLKDERDISVKNKFNFKTYDGLNLTQVIKKDHKFDLVTIMMVLHHVKEFHQLLTNIYYIMSKGGILIIRDHDINNKLSFYLVKIQHQLMDEVYSDSVFTGSEMYSKYYGKSYFIQELKTIGFRYIPLRLDFLIKSKINPTNYMYLCFRK